MGKPPSTSLGRTAVAFSSIAHNIDVHPSLGAWICAGGNKTNGLLLLDAAAEGNVECGVMAPRSLIRPPWVGKWENRWRIYVYIYI